MASFLRWFGSSKRIARWSGRFKSMMGDYATVCKDVLEYAKKKPFRFTTMITIGSLAGVSWKKNPDMNGFMNEVLQYSNEISSCSELTRNPAAQGIIEGHLLGICNRSLDHVNLGVCSLIIRLPNYKDCRNFMETCPQLKPHWWTMRERIVDVGFWDKWWLLEKHMIDYDVNPESF